MARNDFIRFQQKEERNNKGLRLVLYAAKHIIHPMICRILFTSVRVGDALFCSEYVMGISLFLPLIGGAAARAERAHPLISHIGSS